MADQKAIINVVGPGGRQGIRVTFVDTDGSAAKFTNRGDDTNYVPGEDQTIVSIQPVGSTAPATANLAQLNSGGNDKQDYINYAAVYDPKATMEDRLGTLLGITLKAGRTYRLISRA